MDCKVQVLRIRLQEAWMDLRTPATLENLEFRAHLLEARNRADIQYPPPERDWDIEDEWLLQQLNDQKADRQRGPFPFNENLCSRRI